MILPPSLVKRFSASLAPWLLGCAMAGSSLAQVTMPKPGRPLPQEGTEAWKKIIEPRQQQLDKGIAAKMALIAKMPKDTITALDLPYVEKPIESKFPGSGQKLDLYVPAGTGPFPVIVYIHGGAWNGGNKEVVGAQLATKWMTQGFAIASLSYRFAWDSPFPGMFQDCIDAIDFLRTNAAKYHLNSEKIGVCGNSAGGHIAATVGVTMGNPQSPYKNAKKPVQALVVWCGYGDVRVETTRSGGFPFIYPNLTYDPEIAKKISAIFQIHSGTPPVLIQHGEKDQAVPLEQPRILNQKLKESGHDVTLILYPNYGHGLLKLDDTKDTQSDVHQSALAFFKKHLQ